MATSSTSDNENLFTGQVESDAASLLGLETEGADDVPDFEELFDDGSNRDEGMEDDLAIREFRRPTSFYRDTPQQYFKDKAFYKKALTGEGDVSKRLHGMLASFLNAEDPQDRSMNRSRLIPAYWNFLTAVAPKVGPGLSLPKRLALRFGVLLPTLISTEQRDMIGSVIFENDTGEPIHYVDEWLEEVAFGRVNPSAVDETKSKAKADGKKINNLVEQQKGKYEAQVSLIKNKIADMELQEQELKAKAEQLASHPVRPDFGGLKGPYTEGQRTVLSDLNDIVRRLTAMNKEVSRHFQELGSVKNHLDSLKEKGEGIMDDEQVDEKVVVDELNTVRQMAKLCVGRQGNHFPLLMKQYFRANIQDVATRENVIDILADVEYLDPSVFLRTFKQQTNRIVPNIILVACYGDSGICWEPFERFNRATSRGRLAIPMYPKDLRAAVITALADLRWQVAKEKAQHYWMEEGLTGWYYQWFSDRRRKGDVKDSFIQDYVLWITKESEGTQKLDREVRDIFWRYIPFPQDIKDKLKNRGYVYNELYKKDQNRAMSDGY